MNVHRLRYKCALQEWVMTVSIMQQSVLISGIRGCDGIPKHHKAKPIIRYYRRCVLLSAFDGRALTDAFEPGGGSFSGPIAEINDWVLGDMSVYDWKCKMLQKAQDDFIDSRDELPYHYQSHMMHAFEIVGYKHPDENVREFWHETYLRMVHALHVWPETAEQLDRRLGDDESGWHEREDRSSNCSM